MYGHAILPTNSQFHSSHMNILDLLETLDSKLIFLLIQIILKNRDFCKKELFFSFSKSLFSIWKWKYQKQKLVNWYVSSCLPKE